MGTETRGWDAYWEGSSSGVAYGQEGIDHPLLKEFWERTVGLKTGAQNIIDVASGRGALLAHMNMQAEIYSLDISRAALLSQSEAHPLVHFINADARFLPLRDSAFDLVVSQFGVEYGGISAIDSLPVLVKPGGSLVLALHHVEGSIHQECQVNLAAIEGLRNSGFLALAEQMFKAGYGRLRGEVSGQAVQEAARAVLEPFRYLTSLLDQHGENVAGGTIRTLCTETARMQERLQHHVEEDVIGWLQEHSRELSLYEERMKSMCAAALTENKFREFVERLQQDDFTIVEARPLNDDGDTLAWVLDAVASQ
jgi:hypothetical protein